MSKKVNGVMADEDNLQEFPQAGRIDRAAEKQRHGDRVSRATQAGVIGRTRQFIRDVRAEMKRVSWPSTNEVKNTTIITLVAVIFFSVYLFAVDRVWAFLMTQLNHLLNWLTGA